MNNDILEKLEIIPDYSFDNCDRIVMSFEVSVIRRLKEQRDEMLEALIELCIDAELIDQGSRFAAIEIIEKATGKSWEEIKELMNEQ